MTALPDVNENLNDQEPANIFNQLSYNDFRTVLLSPRKSSGEMALGHLSFDSDIYGKPVTNAVASHTAQDFKGF